MISVLCQALLLPLSSPWRESLSSSGPAPNATANQAEEKQATRKLQPTMNTKHPQDCNHSEILDRTDVKHVIIHILC